VPDRSSWSDAALSAELLERAAAAERAQAELVDVTAEWLARSAWAADGATSGPAWLTAHAALTRPAATRLCATATLVHEHDQTAKALNVGDVTVAHIEVLATAVKRREELYPEHEDTLLDAARSLTPDDLVIVARRWRALADDELAAVDSAAVYEQRYLQVSPTMGGAHTVGFLDPVGATTVINALDVLSPPDPSSDLSARALSVRYADAFVMLAEASLANPVRGGSAQANVDVVVDAQTLIDPAHVDACSARCDLEGYGPIGRVVAARLACDAKVARIVMAGASRVLDLGRSTRVVSPALRKAVALRDRHCRARGCRVPAKWCDVHHIVHWLDGGPTDLENLVLVCRRHHVDHHAGGWRFVRRPDGAIEADSSRAVNPRGRIRRRRQSRPGRSDL
jgi:hypothetical protein